MQRQVLPSTTWGQTPWTSCHLRRNQVLEGKISDIWDSYRKSRLVLCDVPKSSKLLKVCRKVAVPYGFASSTLQFWPGWNSSQPTLWCTKRGLLLSLVLATSQQVCSKLRNVAPQRPPQKGDEWVAFSRARGGSNYWYIYIYILIQESQVIKFYNLVYTPTQL